MDDMVGIIHEVYFQLVYINPQNAELICKKTSQPKGFFNFKSSWMS